MPISASWKARIINIVTLFVFVAAAGLVFDATVLLPRRNAASRAMRDSLSAPIVQRGDLRGLQFDLASIQLAHLTTHPTDSGDIGGAQAGLKLIYLYTSSCKFCRKQREHMAELFSDSTLPPRYAMTPEGSADAVQSYWEGTPLAAQARFRLAPRMTSTLAKINMVPTVLVINDSGAILRAATGMMLSWSRDSLHAWIRSAAP